MALRIYNSLTQQKEEFKPLDPLGKEVKMYVCGPTVYDEPHIGHLRSAYVFEVIRNWLTHSGYKVQFVRNVTDVDDKIINKARQEKAADLKTATTAVSSKYFNLYKQDLVALGISEPTTEPRATGHIAQMQTLISGLIQKGFAYHVPGSSDVYFEVKKFAQYGKLSKQKIDEMMDQARKESAPGKRDPLDFALWKGAKPDEPMWDSPWGPGRPGWHIECSAMNLACLGEQIDIHGGGLDLKFPHHENEIAQSEAATGKSFAKYWIHHGLVTVNDQKMSKSLKNFITLGEISKQEQQAVDIKKGGPAALKLLFLNTHYSSSLDYSDLVMSSASSQWMKFSNFLYDIKNLKATAKAWHLESSYDAKFAEAMNDDFNTPKAMAVMHDLISVARKDASVEALTSARKQLSSWGMILGKLFVSTGESVFPVVRKLQIEEKVRAYAEARKKRDFLTSDLIRKELLADGIEIRDLSNGFTEWRAK